MAKKKKRKFEFLRKKFPMKMQKKLVMLFMAVILAFVGLIIRITYINASSGEKYTKIVLDQQQYDSKIIPFKRGDILDRNGSKLATSERVYNVILDAKVLLSDEKKQEKIISETASVVQECFGITETELRAALKEKPESRYIIMKKQIDYDTAKKFEEMDEDNENYPLLMGIWLEDDYIRSYPYDTLASDVLGFTSSGNVGNGGLESSYNDILNGTDGREYGYLDYDSSLERVVKEAKNGDHIVTTLDLNLQSMVEEVIAEFNKEYEKYDETTGRRTELGSKNTAVIIMDPNTGNILTEATYPFYNLNDPRDLTSFYSDEEIANLENTTNEKTGVNGKIEALQEIWKNFAVTDTFEPGSTMKPFTVAAGLESGKLTGNETYVCGGSLRVVENAAPIPCHYKDGHGTETIQDAVANSCNVALMHMVSAIGPEEFCKYQKIFGFGEYTGIDLPGEALGILYQAEDMGPIDLATNSFGQNFNVTMTQMAAAFCSLVNGGNYYEPHLVKQIQDADGNVIENKDPVLMKKTISQKTSDMVKEYLRAVVEYGTGTDYQIEGYDIGGKTGTAQKHPRSENKHLLSFAGAAPISNPEVVIYVVIDEINTDNQSNSAYVADLSKRIMEKVFPYLGITQIEPAADDVPAEE